MKEKLEHLIIEALNQLTVQLNTQFDFPRIQVDNTKDKKHGDYACNIAMLLSKALQKNPREIAELIIQALPQSSIINKVDIAGPGFINFFLAQDAVANIVIEILEQKELFGKATIGNGKKILLEFVSTNPTGPLHVGHGRHASVGAVLADLLENVGYEVHREYYVNDGGRQIDILAVSVWLRYIELLSQKINFPINAYQGSYIITIAQQLLDEHKAIFLQPIQAIFSNLPKDETEGGDKEAYIDAIISRAKELLDEENFHFILKFSLEKILLDIRTDLAEFGVYFDEWFSEYQFAQSDTIDRMIKKLNEDGLLYKKENALWFKSTLFGDDKDRVLQRANGQRTYFANDLAYHLNKFERGFDHIIDVFGSDHHGYIPRMQAGLKANGIPSDKVTFITLQFVFLYRAGELVSMSTRSGSFVPLRELRKEVGNDAARYFYIARRHDQPVDFDLDLAKAKSNENPVYYIQYAYARICSVFRQLADKNLDYLQTLGIDNLGLLSEPIEHKILNTLSRFKETIFTAAQNYEPNLLTQFLRDLAANFHGYYNSHQFIVDDEKLRNARLTLCEAIRQVLTNGLKLLDISTPDTM